MCLKGDDWDPYDESYADCEESYTDFRGDIIDHPLKHRKLIDDVDIGEICVSAKRYKYAISFVVANNHDTLEREIASIGMERLQDDDLAFNRDDDYTQAGIADLTACFDEDLL